MEQEDHNNSSTLFVGHIVDVKSTAANNGGEEGRSCRGRVAKSLYYYDSAYEPNVPMDTYNKIR